VNAPKKPTLGRSLSDLLGQARPRPPAAPVPLTAGAAPTAEGATAVAATGAAPPNPHAPPAGEELVSLPLDLLQRGKYQPRSDLRQEPLEELAISIRSQGVIQPIVVRALAPPAAGEPQRYEIVAGERRWRAAQIAGLARIPAIVRRIPDDAAIAMALIENIQRENLNPLEEARALERLIAEFGVTHQQAADAVGRSRAAVSNLLRLLELAPEIADLVEKRKLEMGHARALLALTVRRQQAEVGALVARNGLSVRETEALVRRMLTPAAERAAGGTPAADPNVSSLQQDLSEKLGAKVLIQQGSGGKGKLVIAYNSLDELDGILAHIQ
jgi:ParB family chromosome partitioning protein